MLSVLEFAVDFLKVQHGAFPLLVTDELTPTDFPLLSPPSRFGPFI